MADYRRAFREEARGDLEVAGTEGEGEAMVEEGRGVGEGGEDGLNSGEGTVAAGEFEGGGGGEGGMFETRDTA